MFTLTILMECEIVCLRGMFVKIIYENLMIEIMNRIDVGKLKFQKRNRSILFGYFTSIYFIENGLNYDFCTCCFHQ